MGNNDKVIAVVDIGSTKVCAMIGQVYSDGKIKIEGEGSVSCRGFKKLIYADPETITTSIKRALILAQEKANIIVSSIYLNIRGVYLNYVKKNFTVEFGDREKEIDGNDILKLIKQASKIDVYDDETIVDVIPFNFCVDGDTQVNDPVGMMGKSLSADVSIVIGHSDVVNVLCGCAKKLGLIVDGIIPEAYPVAMSQMRATEKKGNTLILDVGGKITEFTVYKDGVVSLNMCMAIGGDNITKDIAKSLDISNADAETLKRDIGYAAVEAFRQNRDCYITHVGTGDTEMVRASYIIGIIENRVSYILDKVKITMEREGVFTNNIDNIIIVGEGMRSLNGINIAVRNIFGIESRKPDFFVETGYMPTYLVAYSTIFYVASCVNYGRSYSSSTIKRNDNSGNIGGEVKGARKYLNMIKEFFTLSE